MKVILLFTIFLISIKSFAVNNCANLFTHKDNAQNSELSIFNKESIQEKYRDYYLNAKIQKPEPLRKAFMGIINGRMSPIAFDQLVEAYTQQKPITLKVLVSKAEWSELHKNSPQHYPENTPFSMIEEYLKDSELSFSVEKETNQFYVISFQAKDQSDIESLSNLSLATFTSYIYTQGTPTNMLRRASESDFQSLAEYTRKRLNNEPMNIRYSFIQKVKDASMSFDAAKAIVDFNGKEFVYLDYHVAKRTMKSVNPRFFKGTQQEIEEFLRDSGLQPVSLGENNDLVSYRVKISTERDLEKLRGILLNAYEGTITLAVLNSIQ